MRRFIRAQTSVELIIVLAISLVILSLLVSITTDTLLKVKKQDAVKTAQESMNALVEAINQTYQGGSGTVRFVTLTWPGGLDSNVATLSENTIRIHLYDTNIIGQTVPLVTGTLATNEGTQRVRMIATDTNVNIGSLFLIADQSTIYLPLSQDTNASAQVTVYNLSGVTTSVTFSRDWSHGSLVDVSLSPSSATLVPDGSQLVTIHAAAGSSAIGNYTGTIRASATFGGTVETLDIPLNIEVFSTASSLLSVYPSPTTLTVLAGDTNYSTIQVCNNGDTDLKTISFTPSTGNAGDWINAMSSISAITANTCTDKNITITPPGSTSIGSYSGSLLISDYTGANNQILPLNVNVKGMASDFSWDWNSASFSSATTITGFGLRNTGTANNVITSLTLSKWWSCDSNHSTLTTVVENGNTVFSSNANDGSAANVTDFNVNAGVTYTNNSLTFSSPVNDENEQFQAAVTFSDGTTYTSTVFGSGCVYDTNAPAPLSDIVAFPGSEPGSIHLRFTFSGDDNFSGTATNLIMKYSTSSDINTAAGWANGTTLTYSGSYTAGGTTGTLDVTDLNTGVNYYFAGVFEDELDNNGGFSLAAKGRPWNSYEYALDDFNITNFAHSLSTSPPAGYPGDVNQFYLSNLVARGGFIGDKNIVFRVVDDGNTNNSWITALDVRGSNLIRTRIWYPIASQEGVPSTTPQYTGVSNFSIASGFSLIDANTSSTYRYNGSAVSLPRPNHLYVNLIRGYNDLNVTFDLNET